MAVGVTRDMKAFPKELLGTWCHTLPWDSDDYLAEYTVSLRRGKPVVSAIDVNDEERFKISNVAWDGTWLRFTSRMSSTGRIGLNEIKVKKNGKLQVRFTFTIEEEMERSATQQGAAADAAKRRG
jgi:hypothetical protein